MIDGLPPGSNKIKTVEIDPEIQDYRKIQNSDLDEKNIKQKFHMIDEKIITELSREYAKDSCPVEKQQEAESVLKWMSEKGYSICDEKVRDLTEYEKDRIFARRLIGAMAAYYIFYFVVWCLLQSVPENKTCMMVVNIVTIILSILVAVCLILIYKTPRQRNSK